MKINKLKITSAHNEDKLKRQCTCRLPIWLVFTKQDTSEILHLNDNKTKNHKWPHSKTCL